VPLRLTRSCAATVLATLLACWSGREARVAGDPSAVALEFTTALLHRDFGRAYAMTSQEYQRGTSVEQMRAGFEAIVPTAWRTTAPPEVTQTLANWPDKRASDVHWAYVGISGDAYSEAVTVVVMLEDDTLRIRTVEFGRP
jgi:hypothetical protein